MDSTARPLSTELALVRESQDRQLEREGIPMFLALVDERPGRLLPGGDSGDGQAVAGALGDLREQLASHQRDGDMGIVRSLLQAVAYADANAPA